MSLVDIALMPVRMARRIGGADRFADDSRPPDRELVVVGGMPEGVPPAALRPEPDLPAPADWPFGEDFPRTCGTARFAGGALFWTDFLYDDHGATGLRVNAAVGRVVPAKGTYVYPDGPAAGNGADIFRVAVGLSETHTWWRVDWNTLLDPSVPIALFTFDTRSGRTTTDQWPAGAGVRSAGIDSALLISCSTAQLIDPTTQERRTVAHAVDMMSGSFLAKVPRSVLEPRGTWTVRLAAGLANAAGDGFADVPEECGALAGQPNVYNVAFRSREQEPIHHNFWSERSQAAALTDGDVSQFSLAVPWNKLAAGCTTDDPILTGVSSRWYASSAQLGDGVAQTRFLSNKPQFLGRVQPYSVCVPKGFAPGDRPALTLLLHSIAMGQNQFAAVDARLVERLSDERQSVVATPLGRGPSCWYFDEGELDVWEVWARVAAQLGTDPNRTVIAGYSMGGYAAYRLGLTYPSVFAQVAVFAGPPTCGIRLLPNVGVPATLDPDSHCADEGETWPLLRNARWLPFVIAHGLLDEFVPFWSVIQQVLRLDRLGYRYRFTVYPAEDHVAMAVQNRFDDPIAHLGTGTRQADPGRITFTWYPQHARADLGVGPHRVWWLSELRAAEHVISKRGAVASVDAQTHARPDPAHRTRRRGGLVLNFKPMPGVYTERLWERGRPREPRPVLTLKLTGVAGVNVDVARCGLATLGRSTIEVTTDGETAIGLERLAPRTSVQIDGVAAGATVVVPQGRHRIVLSAEPSDGATDS